MDLPDDINLYILEFLSMKDLLNFSIINKKAYNISKRVEKTYDINLNISKLDKIASINKFSNTKFSLNLFNDSILKYPDTKFLSENSNITKLKLIIDKNFYYIHIPKNLNTLDLFVCDTIENMDIIRELLYQCSDGMLKYLRIHTNIEYKFLTRELYLNKLCNLEELHLTGKYNNNINFIKEFRHLKKLSLNFYDVIRENDIQYINENILHLYISIYSCENINTIARRFKKLKTLGFCYTTLKDISNIYLLSELEELELKGSNNIVDIKPISYLRNLKILNLNSCENIENIDCLRYMENLEKLTLSCTGVSNLEPLSKLRKLNYLDLFDCFKITDMTYIRNIETLDISNTNIKDFSCIEEGVKYLSLYMSDISDVSHFNHLKKLDISYNKYVSDLSMLTNLESINIQNCSNIKDISSLVNIKEIKASIIEYEDIYPFTIAKKIVLNMVNTERIDFSFKLFKNCDELDIYFMNHIDELVVDKSFKKLSIDGNLINNLILDENISKLIVNNVNIITNIEKANLVI